ncbi:MAG: hypothetical protein WD049_07340 [Candidatus Paceibacterota bacterium]
MASQTRTLAEIRQQGCEALRQHLGVVGMIRFLQQSETGRGNDSDDREQWLGDPDIDEVASRIRTRRKSSGREEESTDRDAGT